MDKQLNGFELHYPVLPASTHWEKGSVCIAPCVCVRCGRRERRWWCPSSFSELRRVYFCQLLVPIASASLIRRTWGVFFFPFYFCIITRVTIVGLAGGGIIYTTGRAPLRLRFLKWAGFRAHLDAPAHTTKRSRDHVSPTRTARRIYLPNSGFIIAFLLRTRQPPPPPLLSLTGGERS